MRRSSAISYNFDFQGSGDGGLRKKTHARDGKRRRLRRRERSSSPDRDVIDGNS
ncbi:hypothetical protein MA16_Dca012103 [Dendrobium catenatum]|uniref:Uncharacterized protein n=1 Tax=Dendrobium catenatum TaxID=906689 RepID=A0A2I0WW84_9ASPA|nr:hypothetical protein MA16_Dca012103 [Dendrobium catenatum]